MMTGKDVSLDLKLTSTDGSTRRQGLMGKKVFAYDDDWKTEMLECPVCHWRGTFEEGAVEYYEALMDCSCPKCNWSTAPMLAIVAYTQHKNTD